MAQLRSQVESNRAAEGAEVAEEAVEEEEGVMRDYPNQWPPGQVPGNGIEAQPWGQVHRRSQ